MRRLSLIFAAALLVANVNLFPALAAGNGAPAKVTLLPDHKYYDALSGGIRRAKREIKGCFFLFKVSAGRNSLPLALVDELIAAHRRGVRVSLELEQDTMGKGSVYEQNRRAASMLKEAGVSVRFDVPRTTTHVKAMVIDGRFVYLGSHNLTQSALKYNNELSVMIDSPELAAEVGGYLDNL